MNGPGGWVLAFVLLFVIGVDLGTKAYLWHLRRKVAAKAAATESADDGAARAADQAILADSFTRLFEVAEGRRNAMLAAGWSETSAEMCAALMFASLIQNVTTKT